ncbi:hypothetical protein [Arthrobacter sp. UYCo732]|uniref:hypothetical protein n=1 Tax=Arthrobacter sp. UYCo732 TaxID=3156336 RepID=UPI003395AF6D
MSLEDDVMEAIARHQTATQDAQDRADLAKIPVIHDWAVDAQDRADLAKIPVIHDWAVNLAARLEAMPGVSPYNSLPVYLRVSVNKESKDQTTERYEMVGRGWDLYASDKIGESSKAIILMDDGVVRTGGGNSVPRPRTTDHVTYEGFDPDHQRVIIPYNEGVLSKLDESSHGYDEYRRLFGVGGIVALTLGTVNFKEGRLSWRCT